MQLAFQKRFLAWAALCSALPVVASATTVVVNGLDDVPGVSYKNLSGAVAYVQSTGPGPHTVNVTVDSTPGADGEVLITTGPLTINGDADGNGQKCDILVDLATIMAAASSLGQSQKCYIEIQSPSTVVINNLKIHPNADCTATMTNAVDGIRMYRPANLGEVGTYILDQVWVSGSDANDQYVDLGTGTDLYNATGVKRWSQNVSAKNAAANETWAAIHVSNVGGAGTYSVELKNCHAGLSRSSAVNLLDTGGTVKVTGGLFGHCQRDGIHATTTGTIAGTATNRVRIVRAPYQSAKDAHGLEIASCTMDKIEYVDISTITSGNMLKFAGSGKTDLVQYVRLLGKMDTGANTSFYASGSYEVGAMKNCTLVGSGGDYRPLQLTAAYGMPFNFTDCIFTSENLGYIAAENDDDQNGVQGLINCAIPTDAYAGESLDATAPIKNNSTLSTFLPTPANSVSVSPHYVKKLADYDWSEAAVSIDGSNPAAGNPDVLRPSSPDYNGKASDGSNLVGGAGPVGGGSAVHEWSLY